MKMKTNIIHNIFQFIPFTKKLKISQSSLKLQNILSIDIETFLIANDVIGYYTQTPINVLQIESDSAKILNILNKKTLPIPTEFLTNSITKPIAYNTQTQSKQTIKLKKTPTEIKNIIFNTQISLLHVNYIPINSNLLHYNKSTQITSLLIIEKIHVLLFGTQSGTLTALELKKYNTKSNSPLYTINAHKNKITKIIQISSLDNPSKNTFTIATGSFDSNIKIWSLKSSEISLFATLNHSPKPVFSLCGIKKFSLASGSSDIRVWNLMNFGEYYPLEKHYGSVYSLLPVDNGENILVGSSKLIKLSTRENKLRGIFQRNENIPTCTTEKVLSIRHIVTMPNGDIIIAEDEHVKICNFDSKPCTILTTKDQDVKIHRIEIIDDEHIICCNCNGKDVQLVKWNVKTCKIENVILTSIAKGIFDIIRGEEEDELIVAGGDGRILRLKMLIDNNINTNLSYDNEVYYDENGECVRSNIILFLNDSGIGSAGTSVQLDNNNYNDIN